MVDLPNRLKKSNSKLFLLKKKKNFVNFTCNIIPFFPFLMYELLCIIYLTLYISLEELSEELRQGSDPSLGLLSLEEETPGIV